MTYYVVSYKASASEVELLEAIEEVGYGEIYAVELEAQEPFKAVQISEKTRNFFRTLREIGEVEKVVIHDGEPTLVEYKDRTSSGHRCLKKRKM